MNKKVKYQTNQKIAQEFQKENHMIYIRPKNHYLKENINPNNKSMNSNHTISIHNNTIKIQQKSNNTSFFKEDIKKQKKYDFEIPNIQKASNFDYKQTKNGNKKINNDKIADRSLVDQDFIKPQDVGMNPRLVLQQLQNVMQRQIQRQKAQINNLNNSINELRSKQKQNLNEIQNLRNKVNDLQEQVKCRPSQQIVEQNKNLLQQNERLKLQMQEMQQMIKNILLERQKQRMSL